MENGFCREEFNMFRLIDPKQLDQNVFSLIGDKWMLITAGNGEVCNTMTASWGGLGICAAVMVLMWKTKLSSTVLILLSAAAGALLCR